MTTAGSITLKGASGTKREFTLYKWGTEFKPVCAVYAILVNKIDGYHLLYIGHTGDCSERFDSHHKEPCFKKNGVTHIGLMIENAENKRLTIEDDLIKNYNPPCNG